jgi:hypothetical protein
MHPILTSWRRAGIYLLVWIPVQALMELVSRGSSRALWPNLLLFAFLCLTPWYVCRARPLQLSNAVSLAWLHLGAAATASALLVGGAVLTAAAIGGKAPEWVSLFAMGVSLYLVSVGLHYAALGAETSREAERRAAEARTLTREAELLSLRAQINPHFLFNSLHSISALTTIDGGRARDMCVRLADFLRSSVSLGSRESIPLNEELALARSYLGVEQMRFGTRLRVEEEVDESCGTCAIPALLLQPLVENAVKHGIAGLVDGGQVRLQARCDAAEVSITLENAVDTEMRARHGLGMGQAHVRRRLEVRYGGRASFHAANLGDLYRVVLRFPCESPMASSSRA